jgi:hypothetical protein
MLLIDTTHETHTVLMFIPQDNIERAAHCDALACYVLSATYSCVLFVARESIEPFFANRMVYQNVQLI